MHCELLAACLSRSASLAMFLSRTSVFAEFILDDVRDWDLLLFFPRLPLPFPFFDFPVPFWCEESIRASEGGPIRDPGLGQLAVTSFSRTLCSRQHFGLVQPAGPRLWNQQTPLRSSATSWVALHVVWGICELELVVSHRFFLHSSMESVNPARNVDPAGSGNVSIEIVPAIPGVPVS